MTIRDRMTLTLAAAHYRYEGRRTADARWLLGYSEVAFHRRVLWLLDQPDAAAEMPVEVARLRRLREARARKRRASFGGSEAVA